MSTKQDCDMNKKTSAHDTVPLMTQRKRQPISVNSIPPKLAVIWFHFK